MDAVGCYLLEKLKNLAKTHRNHPKTLYPSLHNFELCFFALLAFDAACH